MYLRGIEIDLRCPKDTTMKDDMTARIKYQQISTTYQPVPTSPALITPFEYIQDAEQVHTRTHHNKRMKNPIRASPHNKASRKRYS